MNLSRPPESSRTPPTAPLPADWRQMSLQETIADHARALWEGYGRPVGRDLNIWLEAERQLLGADEDVVCVGEGTVSARALSDAVGSHTGTPA